jgi:2'-5' RNA ligase
MLKTNVYSIWLIPTGEVYNRLNTLISKLSKNYNTPYFEPHVTLISKVLGSDNEIIQRTSQLSSLVRKYRIELNRVEYLDEYFRCLFLRLRETNEVMGANREAREIFGRKTDPKYMPHLSLMYGDFPPDKKREIIAEIGNEIQLTFDVESIHLFSTNNEPNDWYRIKEFSLK